MDFLRIWLYITPILACCQGFLNIEELTDMKYALDILNKPVNSLEVNPAEGMKLSSRHGQEYYCKLPVQVAKAETETEEKIPKTTPIASLLEPMRHEDCLKIVKGWWTYEFCYGKYIKQYHSEDDVPKGDITYLGYFESDFDWNKETVDESSLLKRHKLNRYHSQSYVNGTTCDVINYRRDTEIRFVCDDSSMETYIARVDEPSTCSYVITVRTPYICSHPHTRPLRNPKPVEIVCRPVLSPNDYAEYEEVGRAQLEERKKREAQLKNAKNVFEQLSSVSTKSDSQDVTEENAGDVVVTDATANDRVQFFSDMFKLLGGMMSTERVEQIIKNIEMKEAGSSLELAKKDDDGSQEAREMIERFIVPERLQSIEPFQQTLLVRNVVDLMKSNKHLPSADRARLVEKYVSEYVGALEDLQSSEKQMDELQGKLQQSFLNEAVEDVQREGEGDNPVKVKLKIQQIKSMDHVNSLTEEELLSQSMDAEEMDPTWKKLEDDIGRGLEEAGLDVGSNQIEIRVMTNQPNIDGALDLENEEGQRFKQMLVELVGGGSARKKEMSKQKSLNTNYNLVWRKGKAEVRGLGENKDETEDMDWEIRSPKM